MLEGEVTVWAGENKVVLNAGESFLITSGTTHVVGVLSDQPARLLVVAAPSGLARLIATTGTLDQAETPDMALIERFHHANDHYREYERTHHRDYLR